jgi:hypothetical protein
VLKFTDSSTSPSIISIPLPKLNGTQISAATLNFTAYPIYPQFIESAISPCPGDFSSWTSSGVDGGSVSAFGATFYPCHLITDGGSASPMYYNTTGAYDTCKVPANSNWYVNIRYISSAPTAPATIAGWPLNGTYGCTGVCASGTSWGPH